MDVAETGIRKIEFNLDMKSGVSYYKQIILQVEMAIADGRLTKGEQLPTVRSLAVDLRINPNTVAKAYLHLEQIGLVTTKTGSGTFVSDPALRSKDPADMNLLTERMDTIISRAVNLGLSSKEITKLFNDRIAQFLDQTKRNERKK